MGAQPEQQQQLPVSRYEHPCPPKSNCEIVSGVTRLMFDKPLTASPAALATICASDDSVYALGAAHTVSCELQTCFVAARHSMPNR
jgi:hypothetical protein